MDETILICLPTYHSPSQWITRAVDSLLNQSYPNFQCWIVKDGCSHACSPFNCSHACQECNNCSQTIQLCNQLVQNDPRFKFFTLPLHFGGAGWGPRNFAILNTDHDLIAYLDDDNWYDPNHLEELYKAIQPNHNLAYTGTRLYNVNKEIIHERLHNALPAQGYIDTSEILHRRSLITKYGGWHWVTKGNDWDVVQRWLPNLSWNHTNKITLNFFVRENCGIHRT